MCKGLKEVGPSTTGSMEDTKQRYKLEEIQVKLKSLLTTDQHKEHGGEFVALERGGKRQVIASGKSYKKVVESAKNVAVSFLVVAVPKKGAIHTH